MPKNITKILGSTNSEIVNTLILDVIKNSINKPYLKFSDEIFESLINLKKWNYENIYSSNEARKNHDILEKAFNELYEYYKKSLERKRKRQKPTRIY